MSAQPCGDVGLLVEEVPVGPVAPRGDVVVDEPGGLAVDDEVPVDGSFDMLPGLVVFREDSARLELGGADELVELGGVVELDDELLDLPEDEAPVFGRSAVELFGLVGSRGEDARLEASGPEDVGALGGVEDGAVEASAWREECDDDELDVSPLLLMLPASARRLLPSVVELCVVEPSLAELLL